MHAVIHVYDRKREVMPTVCRSHDALKKICEGDGAVGWSTLVLLEYTALLFTGCVLNSQGWSPVSVQPRQEVSRSTNMQYSGI